MVADGNMFQMFSAIKFNLTEEGTESFENHRKVMIALLLLLDSSAWM